MDDTFTQKSYYDDPSNPEAILEYLSKFLLDLTRKHIPRSIVPPDVLDLEIDEIVQRCRIKLWQALTRSTIQNIKAYARCIVMTECIDMTRRHKNFLPLAMNDDGEIYQGELLISPGQGMQNPADEFEQAEALLLKITRIIEHIMTLPPRQRYSMICTLKDLAEDLPVVAEIFLSYGLNVTTIVWPPEQIEIQRLRALRSVAQKKLRTLITLE